MCLCLEYLIEFEETGSERKEWEELSRVSGNIQRTAVPLKPFISYRFRIIAINDIGKSDPSKETEAYSTPAARKLTLHVCERLHCLEKENACPATL